MNVLIPPRYSSLKTLFNVVHLTEKLGGSIKKSISDRANILTSDTYRGYWQYSVGGKNIPLTPDKTITEAGAELCKSFHAFGAQIHTSLFIWETYSAPFTHSKEATQGSPLFDFLFVASSAPVRGV